MPTTLAFTTPDALPRTENLIIIGARARLEADDVLAHLPENARGVWPAMLAALTPGDKGDATVTWIDGDPPLRLCAAALPDGPSRHNSPARPHAVKDLLTRRADREGGVAVLVVLDDPGHAFAVGCAVARALPLYSTKGKNGDEEPSERQVSVAFLGPDGAVEEARVAATAKAIRLACHLVDQPTSELHTDAFVDRAREVVAGCGASIEVIRDEELRDRGFGGMWGVGKAATFKPALAILKHEPEGASRTVCWVGKGVVYDTGGLSIKGSAVMPGMKRDMGGAAAVLGAFQAAVENGFPDRLYAILCLAENSVGPDATRPDDILHMYSGKTVEVNNTDAEGRLVVADGVAYASKHLSPDVIVDVATLTGAQMISTGNRHAAIVCNDDDLENQAIAAGQRSGDLVHPLVYCPEFFRAEFESKVADLKNSVKDRLNAQASCAAQFIAENLAGFEGPWLHIDMAGPSDAEERGTGYGVALLVEMFQPSRG